MFQRTLLNKARPCLFTTLRINYIRKISNTPGKVDGTVTLDSAQDNVTGQTRENASVQSYDAENLSRLLDESATYCDAKDPNWGTPPYPEDALKTQEQEPEEPKPSDHSVILFPGQGTIKVGMVQKYLKFPHAKELFEIANEILNYNLLKLCLDGPQKKLDQTQFNQPATVITCLAALERLREERPASFESCVGTAGYSVGELTSLIFSGAFSVEDGIRLVSARGTAMQYASEKVPQGMLSVYCPPDCNISQVCKEAQDWAQNMGVENPVCSVAIYLYTQGRVIAGNEEALKYIEQNAKKFGLAKLRRLPVSGAFHTMLMEPALKSFGRVLSTVQIDEPRCKVYANHQASIYNSNPKLIRKLLLRQITHPVKWEQLMHKIFARRAGIQFPRSFDVGSGGRMNTILKLINLKAAKHCIMV